MEILNKNNLSLISVTPIKLSYLSDTTAQVSNNANHHTFGYGKISDLTDDNVDTAINVGSGQNRWVRFTFPKVYEVEFMVISGYNQFSTMYFEVGNSTTAGENLLCNTENPVQKTVALRSVICGSRRMFGKYAIFYGNGSYFIREFEVYGWKNV